MKEPTYEIREIGPKNWLVNFPFTVRNPHRAGIDQAERDNLDGLQRDPTGVHTYSAVFGQFVLATFEHFPSEKFPTFTGLEIGTDTMQILADRATSQEIANFFAAAGDSLKFS